MLGCAIPILVQVHEHANWLMIMKIKFLRKPTKKISFQQGIVILEALIAILIFSMGILALVGLQATMLKNTTESKYRADASYIAQQRIGTLWADPVGAASGTYDETNADISDLLPSGKRSSVRSGTQFTVTVTWQAPGEAQHNFITIANITGG